MDPRRKQRDKIVSLLEVDKMSKVVLVGDAGMGKTRLAREISDILRESAGYRTIWLYLNRKYEERSLYESIARQLSLLSEYEECEDDGKEEKKEEKPKDLKRRIAAELERMKAQNLLLILDDEGCKTSEKEVMTDLALKSFLTEKPPLLKVLITTRKGDGNSTNEIVKLESLSEDDLLALLRENIHGEIKLTQNGCSRVLSEEDKRNIAKKSMGLPSATIVLAKSLNHITRNGFENLSPAHTRALKELAFSAKEAAGVYNPVLQLAYDLLKSDEKAMSPTLHCFWHSLDVFESCGCINYRDLITHWIFEGYFDPVKSVKKAYQEGHGVLMELLNRGMLKIQEDNVVVPEVERRNLVDLSRRGFFEKTSLGLVRAFRDDKQRSLGKICQVDDMIKTLTTKKKGEKISTILVSGNRLRHEMPKKLFEEKQDLEILGLFDPVFDSLVPSLSGLKNLRVLVLRDYDLLKSIEELSDLQGLHALEISGASCLEEIPDDYFKKVSQLQCLNLSRLRIKSLPSTLSKLSELRCLILRDCPNFVELPNVQPLTNLEVVDLRGSSSLLISKNKRSNRNFAHLQKLQTLDFSHSQIDRLPIFQDSNRFPTLPSLTRLLLKNCTKLTRLTHLKPLSGLQILDLSGAVRLLEFIDASFENKEELKIFDLSGTAICELPDEIAKLSDLRHLILKGCPNLTTLPDIGRLKNLEVLDVSGCGNLTNIKGSFEDMSRLWELNLSGTMIKSLPALPERSSIRRLCLKDCSSMESLPELKGLADLEVFELSGCQKLAALPKLDACEKLQILDLSGCSELKTIDESSKHLTSLRKLNISGTKIEQVPALFHSSNLTHLLIRNCTQNKDLPPKESLSKLQELDLSGIPQPDISFIASLTNLNQLSLNIHVEIAVDEYLKHLRSLKHLEVLSVSGLGNAESLYKVPKLPSLKRLILPDLNITQVIDWSKMEGMAKELSFEKLGLSVPNEIPVLSGKPPLLATGNKAFELLKEKPELCSEKFHIAVCLEDQVTGRANSCRRDVFGYEDIYFKTRLFSDQHQGLLEIHGSCDSDGFPDHVKAEYVSFIDNVSTSGSSILKGFRINAARGLLLEMCMEMTRIFSGETEEGIASQASSLETLWVSNLPKLTTIGSGNLQPGSFKNLKKFSLDCCPKLKTLLPTSQPLTSLEILQIKFCDKLEKVFEEECELPNLQTLVLVGLPKLSVVGAKLPNLYGFFKTNCPQLNDTIESLRERRTSQKN